METTNNRDLVKNNYPRLFYLEPNDILGKVDGRPITPDYTDFCVSFRLTAEFNNRARYNGYQLQTGTGNSFTIGWIGMGGENGETYIDLMGSQTLGNDSKRYLTTYYTDVSYQDFSKHNIVEGLGVESIDIQFKDQWVPTITIKFVDVRGSSLFGREEAIHSNDEITAQNVFGCFFSVPYPKFRLQIKGYYGREVTYQLYCSSFKGSFNANTGNFEATAVFVGYMYGILADIPMAYLMTAPYCSYSGEQYWNDHSANDQSWRLYETAIGLSGTPVKMIDLKESINSAIKGDKEHFKSVLSNMDRKTITDNVSKINAANELVAAYVSILKKLSGKYGRFTRNGSVYKSVELTDDVAKDDVVSEITSEIGTYNVKLEQYGKMINASFDSFWPTDVEVSETGGKYVISVNYPDAVKETNATIADSTTEIDEIEELANSQNGKITIKDLILMYPYIGNVIKNTLCHMETFMYMMKACVDEVYSDEDRTFGKIGLKVSDTDANDVEKDGKVPPFIGIKVNDTTKQVDEDVDIYGSAQQYMLKNIGWMGDILPDAPETRLVNSIFEAMKNKGYNKDGNSTDKESSEDEARRDRDIKVAIYTHLKNIYDRWLISNVFDDYKVSNYFKNFVFIDSFFRNITYELHVNPESLGKQLDSTRNDDGRLLKFISSIATEEHCSMFGLPNTFLFKDGNGNDQEIVDGLVSAFKPIPYSKIGPMESSNKIVILYTYKPSEIVSENNGYRGDFFDIYTDGVVEAGNMPIQLKESSYGYNIPSFGVAFGRQDNAIFKSFKLSMENPVATEQSIRAMSRLSSKSGASKSKIQYYGQDVYQVYSGYSYFCEFDMMGDVQIMPMMYFQLLNIPLFRGAYMIISVSHNMRQGEMTTHVKGMRMSRNALPLTKAWFTPELPVKFDEYGNITNMGELMESFASEDYYYEPVEYSAFDWSSIPSNEKYRKLSGYSKKTDFQKNCTTKEGDSNPIPPPGWKEEHITSYTFKGEGPLKGKQITLNKLFVESKDVDGITWVERFEEEVNKMYETFTSKTEKEAFAKKINRMSWYEFRNVNCVSVWDKDHDTPYINLSNHSLGSAFDICPITGDDTISNALAKLNVANTKTKEGVKNTIIKPIGNPYFRQYSKSFDSEGIPDKPKYLTDAKYNGKTSNEDSAMKNISEIKNQTGERDLMFIRNTDHEFVKMMQSLGFGWGGAYGDTMHFSFMEGR